MECTVHSNTADSFTTTSSGHDIVGLGTSIALSLALFGDAMFNGLMGWIGSLGNSLKESSKTWLEWHRRRDQQLVLSHSLN